ncbi:hypothetical protein PVAP13_6KG277806 [Panicum virgatum]|uniref:Uncharacterized protein n=1 Tax=Panicum virgatum TaxID=38727 RepID=A0A8T0RFE9_PANVG|nr:hypothetical protein PVAP13_6KG277806 [Panicum virgatum]
MRPEPPTATVPVSSLLHVAGEVTSAAGGGQQRRPAGACRQALKSASSSIHPLAWIYRPSAGHVTYDRSNTRCSPASRLGAPAVPWNRRDRIATRVHARGRLPAARGQRRPSRSAAAARPRPSSRARRCSQADGSSPPTAHGLPGKLLDAGRGGGEGPRRLRCRCRKQASRVQCRVGVGAVNLDRSGDPTAYDRACV